MTFNLRTAVTGICATAALLLATPVLASGTVTIAQSSPIGIVGDYVIDLPDGTQRTVNDQESKELSPASVGTYTLRITPPSDTHMLVTVTANGVEQSATVSRDVTFTVKEGDAVLVTIRYGYEGTLNVESDPEGASFELLGPANLRDAGVTPATYTNMAPGAYRVTFHRREGCFLVSPMQRSLRPNQTLTFTGKFTCGVTLPPAPPPAEPEPPVADANAGRSLRVWVAAHQAEVLPGGAVRVTLTVRNTGTRTVHDVTLSAQTDPAMLKMQGPLPHFGMIVDDLAVWTIPQLNAGKTWSVTLPFTAGDTMQQGDSLIVTARATGSDLEEDSAGPLLATATIGVTTLPQTGDRFDILFALVSFAAAALLARQTVRVMAKERA